MKLKEAKYQSYNAGLEAFGKFPCAPCLNAEFMATVPNCPMGDSKGCRLRIAMYTAYIKGWTIANLNAPIEV